MANTTLSTPPCTPPYTPPPYRPHLSSPPHPYRPQNAASRVDEYDINLINFVQRCLFEEEKKIKPLELETCHDNSECAICLLENVCHKSNGGKISCCGKTYHDECLKKWFNTGNHSCPTCRSIIR